MKKIIIIVLSLSIILGFLVWKFGPNITGLFSQKEPQGPVTLTYWGLWEEENLVKGAIAEFEKQHPNIKVTYQRQSSVNYRTRVQTQIREGVGPDVFRMHNSWLPMFEQDLYPAPADVLTIADYKNLFYPVANTSFVKGGQIYAAPMEIDGLVLFYNVDILNGVGGVIPTTWPEFIDIATKMTVRDSSGIKTAGAGVGTASNVDHWSDLLGLLLFQQPNVDLDNPATDLTADVLRFYTGFVTNPGRKTWDVNLPRSTDMFVSGRLGFYFAPSWRAHEIRVANPNLNFKTAPVPQLSSQNQVAYGSFWAEAVSKNSKHPKEAWQFVKFLTSEEAEKLMYAEASNVRLFGEPYSLVSLQSELINDPWVGAVVKQGPIYKSWYLCSNTQEGDSGINVEIIKYWEDGINSTLAGADPLGALQTVASGVKQTLDKYTKPAPVPTPE
ncbi:sugar ABC transporter substrate-binding protein [Candidatus Daviesbacteria bacterium]|nr:sugar ABC transporter substrate-binding protein [Candidatus Daviesbacteria bacterium]MBI4035336.1 sugar ABC transporter substrate-binding protein [Candidatus Daviesbacteria bacterium]